MIMWKKQHHHLCIRRGVAGTLYWSPKVKFLSWTVYIHDFEPDSLDREPHHKKACFYSGLIHTSRLIGLLGLVMDQICARSTFPAQRPETICPSCSCLPHLSRHQARGSPLSLNDRTHITIITSWFRVYKLLWRRLFSCAIHFHPNRRCAVSLIWSSRMAILNSTGVSMGWLTLAPCPRMEVERHWHAIFLAHDEKKKILMVPQ